MLTTHACCRQECISRRREALAEIGRRAVSVVLVARWHDALAAMVAVSLVWREERRVAVLRVSSARVTARPCAVRVRFLFRVQVRRLHRF